MLELDGEVNMRSLDEVLKDLDAAEKEFKQKCDLYGIEETSKRKPKNEGETQVVEQKEGD